MTDDPTRKGSQQSGQSGQPSHQQGQQSGQRHDDAEKNPEKRPSQGGATSNATNHKNRTRADSDGLLEFELVFLGSGIGRRDLSFLKRTTAPSGSLNSNSAAMAEGE
jgi:hypothetical protein